MRTKPRIETTLGSCNAWGIRIHFTSGRCSEIWTKKGQKSLASHFTSVVQNVCQCFAGSIPIKISNKKNKAHQNCGWPKFPTVFRGQKNKSPCLFGPKCQKSPRFLPGGRHQGRVQGMSHAPNRLVSGRTCLGTSTKPLEFGSEILDKTQVTTSEHRLKMRNKWKNMEKWGGDSSFQITGL